jgi:hemerythrin-like domain-containing protein
MVGMRAADERDTHAVSGMTGSTSPDPDRIQAGWEHRFVAAGARADEMIELYRQLGYEVAADPVRTHTLEDGCVACFTSGGESYQSIYTRRRTGSEDAHPDRPHARETPMSETHPTQLLRQEHQQILQVAGVLEGLLDQEPVNIDYELVEKCIRFIQLFADACHHGKEEGLLFPALEDKGLPRDSGPIAVMLHEHRLGRQFTSTMAQSIGAARTGDPAALGRLTRAGRDYVALIRQHILKEDNVLFNMADQLVRGPHCAGLCAAYDEVDGQGFEGCSRAQLEELGREICERGAASSSPDRSGG